MAIQSNFPAIKPSLNLDFANTEALDPRITFTRASTATYYDGVTTAKAEENLLLRSQDYSATWTVTNLTPVTGKTAPDTTSTATEFTATAANAVLTQGFTAIAGSYTFSVFLRRVTGSGDIQIAADNGTWTTKVITGTWARYDVTQTVAAGSKTAGVRVVTDTDAIEVWGAQLEQRDAVTAYTATTTQPITNYIPVLLTAATNAPRFDHNPTTGESLGLLIEEQRTNLLLQSEDLDTTWAETRATLNLNSVVSPAGTLTADRLIASTDNNTHFTTQTFTGTAASYTFTVYAKASGLNFVALRLFNGTSQVGLAYYNLSTGATGTVTAGTATITSVGNGWYRCSLTATLAASASCTADIYLANADNTNSFAGNAFDGVALWGFQTELGAFPTSYIATVAATATRSADAASMTGTNFSSWYNQGEGTLFTEFAWVGLRSVAGQRILVVDNGTTTNYWGMVGTSTNIMQNPVVVNGVTEAANSTPATTYSVNTYYKQTVAIAVNNTVAAINGAAGTTDTVALVPTVNTLRLCASSAGVGENIRIRRISYYPLRLTNAQLQALTG
jgi:hypothetical protein